MIRPSSPLTMLLSRHTRRREFIALLGGAAAWPRAARAQQRSKIPRIAYLDPLSRSSRMAAGWVEAFRSGLHDLGYAEGNNIIIEYRWSEGKYDRLAALTAELVHLGIDALVTYGPRPLARPSRRPQAFPLLWLSAVTPLLLV
jgi:putative tryptophan/tyrosine transport system substrate-binding protein